MAENNHNVKVPDMEEKQQMMLENEATMMRNVFIMRSRILSMQVKVAMDKLKAVGSLEGIVDITYATETYRKKADKAFSFKKYEEADRHILEAEQLYSKMASKLFPAKPKIDEKPSEEYLRMKRNKASSNHAGVTVVGNKEDVLRCIDIAKKAFDKNELEKARKWLTRSQRFFYTNDAKELLDIIDATITARDLTNEPQSMNLETGPDTHDDNSAVDPNTGQKYATTAQEPQSICTENIEGAMTCVDNANKLIKTGDLDKAEHFLLKAKRMDSSIDVEQYLKQVRDARDRNTQSTDCAAQEKGSRESKRPRHEQTNLCIDEANTYLQIAENAFNDKNYKRALVFLDKSEELYTSEHASILRKKVKNEITKPKQCFAKSSSTRGRSFKPNSNFNNVTKLNTALATEESIKPEESVAPEESVESEEAVKLQEPVKLKSYSSSTRGRSSKPTSNKKFNSLITSIQKDIKAGNFDEAEKKLQTNGFIKCEQLERLETELKEKKKSSQDNMLKRERCKPQMKPGAKHVDPEESVKPEESMKSEEGVIELQKPVKPDESMNHTKVNVADKAYHEGNLVKDEMLLSPSERLIKALEVGNTSIEQKKTIDNEKLKYNQSVCVENATKYCVVNEAPKLKKNGKEYQFGKATQLQPDEKSNHEVLRHIETNTKQDNLTAVMKNSSPESNEDMSMEAIIGTYLKPSEYDPMILKNKYTDGAKSTYVYNDEVSNTESLIKLCEEQSKTESSREQLLNLLKAKHGVSDEDDEDNKNTIILVANYTPSKKKPKNYMLNKKKKLLKLTGKGNLRSAEQTYIKGNFKVAKHFVSENIVHNSPYVSDLVEIINGVYSKNKSWHKKIIDSVLGK